MFLQPLLDLLLVPSEKQPVNIDRQKVFFLLGTFHKYVFCQNLFPPEKNKRVFLATDVIFITSLFLGLFWGEDDETL